MGDLGAPAIVRILKSGGLVGPTVRTSQMGLLTRCYKVDHGYNERVELLE